MKRALEKRGLGAQWVDFVLRVCRQARETELIDQSITSRGGITITVRMPLAGGWLMDRPQVRAMSCLGAAQASNG